MAPSDAALGEKTFEFTGIHEDWVSIYGWELVSRALGLLSGGRASEGASVKTSSQAPGEHQPLRRSSVVRVLLCAHYVTKGLLGLFFACDHLDGRTISGTGVLRRDVRDDVAPCLTPGPPVCGASG